MNHLSPRILSIGTALPTCTVSQQTVFSLLKEHYSSELTERSLRVMEKIFLHPSINNRFFAFDNGPDISTLKNEDPDKRIDRFTRWAIELSSQALVEAAANADIALSDITCLIVNTCTGYICPGLSTYIIERLRLSPHIKAFDMVGAGCGGAVPNLQMASSMISGGELAASIAVEICSATFEMGNDLSLILSNALFGDGAAAAITGNRSEGISLVDSASYFLPCFRDEIRYVHKSGRLHNRLSAQLPKIAGDAVPTVITGLLSKHNLEVNEIRHWALHPGGAKILDNIQNGLHLTDNQITMSRKILEKHGNMSSPSVLFVLKEILESQSPKHGDWGIITAFGAGMSIHSYLLQW